MTRPSFRLDRIHIWSRDGPTCDYGDGWNAKQHDYPGTDGLALYRIDPRNGSPPHFVRQLFRRGDSVQTKDFIAWGWDGNMDSPTLRPSFLLFGDGYHPRLHIYLTGGKVEALADTEADLEA